jgi:serine/threonine protein kinase
VASEEIPGFEDVSEIGRGAFSTVYRAVETETRRHVALKLIRAGGLPHVLESFDRELQALAVVSGHPNIVTLYRVTSAADGRPVLVLELCRGSYAERVRVLGPLPPREVVSIGVKIAGALETAHRSGLLHRDMKPQNLLETQFGEPALADFGVAALRAAAPSTEGLLGFASLHAPPEVLEGRPTSPATDVYGLASTMYQLLTGRAPFTTFEGETPASVILRILRDPAAPLLAPGVPLALSDALVTALAKVPADRPHGAGAFAEELRAIEASCGWPPTHYAVWGQRPPAAAVPPSDPVRSPPVGPSESTSPPGPARSTRSVDTAAAGGPVPAAGAPPPEAGSPLAPAVLEPIASPRRVLDPLVGPAHPADPVEPIARTALDPSGRRPGPPPARGPVPVPPLPESATRSGRSWAVPPPPPGAPDSPGASGSLGSPGAPGGPERPGTSEAPTPTGTTERPGAPARSTLPARGTLGPPRPSPSPSARSEGRSSTLLVVTVLGATAIVAVVVVVLVVAGVV